MTIEDPRRCDNCKYWKPWSRGFTPDVGDCTKADEPDAKMQACISGGVAIATDADFYCSQFEPKESN